MAINKQEKERIIKEFGGKELNTGAVEVQVAILTADINSITNHVEKNKKDHSSKRGLYQKVSRRRKLLKYLERTDIERYRALIAKLEIRK
ncbi:MAG: 30S ribosomal protein S15 [Mycoplasmataceae bacterium]|jgi:small subunit ribosomal protein S15|nr:30S ribosomal protein S15 [Mycoplasmataceae bacterium]